MVTEQSAIRQAKEIGRDLNHGVAPAPKLRPETPKARLDVVPEFKSGEIFAKDDRQRIVDLLSGCLLQCRRRPGGPDAMLTFATAAISPVGDYVRNCRCEPDQSRAKELLSGALDACKALDRLVSEVGSWPALSCYLYGVYLGGNEGDKPTRTAYDDRSSPEALLAALNGPLAVLDSAVECFDNKWRESRLDHCAKVFVKEVAVAWERAFESFPTCASLSPRGRSRSPSPFAAVLKTINQEVLEEDLRSSNDFHEVAQRVIRELKEERKVPIQRRGGRYSC